MTADAMAAGRAYLDAAGWRLVRGAWLDPDGQPAGVVYPDHGPGVERAVAVERERWLAEAVR